MSRARIGVIDAGVIARRHVRTLARFDDVQIAAVADIQVPHRIGLHLFGDGIAIELGEKEMRVDTGDGATVIDTTGDPFEREDRAFVDAIQGRPDRTRSTYAEALRTHRVTTAAVRSTALGRPVVLDGDGRRRTQ
jgi:hypothetical protein